MEYKPQPDRYTNGMLYRRCGDSGIQLPVISLGFWHNFGQCRYPRYHIHP